MLKMLAKIKKTIQAYYHYLNEAIIEIYLYYISPFPIFTLMKKLVLVHRKIRIIWGSKSAGGKPLDKETIDRWIQVTSATF